MAHQPGWHPYNIKPGRKNCRQVLTHIKISPRTCLILRQGFGTQAGQRLRLTEYLFAIQCKTRLLLYLTKICIHKRISLIQLNSVIQSAYTSIMWNLWFPLVRTPGGLPNAVSSCYSCVVQSNNKAGVEGYQPWGYYIRIWQELTCSQTGRLIYIQTDHSRDCVGIHLWLWPILNFPWLRYQTINHVLYGVTD